MPGKTAARQTTTEFVALLNDMVVTQPKGNAIHIITDNLIAHGTQRVSASLADSPNIQLQLNTTHSPWHSRLELRFTKMAGDVFVRGIFASAPNLKRDLMHYTRRDDQQSKMVKLGYFVAFRVGSRSAVAVRQ